MGERRKMHPSERKKEDSKRDLSLLTRCTQCYKCMGKGIVERVKKSEGEEISEVMQHINIYSR